MSDNTGRVHSCKKYSIIALAGGNPCIPFRFREKEAYEILKRELDFEELTDDSDNDDKVNNDDYSFVFNSFIKKYIILN